MKEAYSACVLTLSRSCRFSAVLLLLLSFRFTSLFCAELPDSSQSALRLINATYLGNYERNFYGNTAPDSLQVIWKLHLGSGITNISSRLGDRVWAGSGWTGQPLLYEEADTLFLLLGAFDYNLKKIAADTGRLIWQYRFDDVIKGTGTLRYDSTAENPAHRLTVLQGSRRGYGNNLYTPVVPSFRCISCLDGSLLWQMDIWRTASYSRDMDGSAVILGDTAYAGLENGMFVSFDPCVSAAELKDGILQPHIFNILPLYESNDIYRHGGNLVTESSPCLLGGRLYITAGSGHVYGYNLRTEVIDWDFYIGSDMDGCAVATSDSCILVPVEKQYISGRGGVFKLDPRKPPDAAVVWYFPTGDRNFASWEGGVIGSPCSNEMTKLFGYPNLAAFIGIDGYLYVVNPLETDSTALVWGPNEKKQYPSPKLVWKTYTGPSISTPVFVGDKLIAAGYNGLKLFRYDEKGRFSLVDEIAGRSFESTPVCHNGRLYIGSRDGFLYCLGTASGNSQ